MIVPMKKIAVIVQANGCAAAIEQLRRQGAVHIQHQQPPKSKDLSLLYDDLGLLDRALEILAKERLIERSGCRSEEKETADFKTTSRHIIDLWNRIDYLEEYGRQLGQKIIDWQQWGDFDPGLIHGLAQKGIHAKLCQVPAKEFNKISQDIVVKRVFAKDGNVYCLLVWQGEKENPFKEIELPKMGLKEMEGRLKQDAAYAQELKKQLAQCLCYNNALFKIRGGLKKEIEFQEVLSGAGESLGFSYLIGFAPAESAPELLQLAKKEKWGIFVSEPSEEDNVPVLLRNPKWISLINPVFKLMEVVPGYRELDVSPLFLLFLALFFGMIIGDAGYGAVYFALTFFARLKFGRKFKDHSTFFLFYLFSSCAIFWGLLTGTVFGQQWYLAKGFKPLAPMLNETKFLMSFCFFLGALQLSLAHGWQAISKLPSLKALADAGFICLLWAGFFLAKMFIVGDPFPAYGKWLIWAGVLLIIFFSNPQRNILRGTAEGLGVLALGIMGNFGDVVSYIRLFAVGMAGVAVADSVNALAAGAGNNVIAQALILFHGHLINIILGPVSILVHGIRLNVLEFSLLHGNVTWSGLAYKPLKN